MITKRPSHERGHFDYGWLTTHHSFSFGNYRDPKHVHFRTLRVINEDWVQPGRGFGTHPHDNMEILTYILEGELEHKDSMGNGSVIRPGQIQTMTAGTGITHSEFNPSKTDPVHLLQIWLVPDQKNLTPNTPTGPATMDDGGSPIRITVVRCPSSIAPTFPLDSNPKNPYFFAPKQ